MPLDGNNTGPIVHLAISDIFIPEGKKAHFDVKNEHNIALMDGLGRIGMLNPIDVRPGKGKQEGKFEIVCGRRRWAAAKKLGWETIPARVGDWPDDEIPFVTIVENTQRKQLNPAELMRLIQQWHVEYEKLFGADPGRKLGGFVRATGALRDPVTKRFLSNGDAPNEKKKEDVHASSDDPARPDAGFAGSDIESSKKSSGNSFTKTVRKKTGLSSTVVKDVVKLSRELTGDQLDALSMCTPPATLEDVGRLVAIEDLERREAAVNLMVTGMTVGEAIKEATGESDFITHTLEQIREDKMTDDEWLFSRCQEIRDQIQNHKAYDVAAVFYRHIMDDRADLRKRFGKAAMDMHRNHISSYSWCMVNFLFLDHPTKWWLCATCFGKNEDFSNCAECKGTGFKVKWDLPKQKRR